MKKIAFLLLIISALADSLNIANAQWVQSNGICGGSVWSIVDSDIGLLAGTEYGIYLSTNNGNNWSKLNNNYNNRASSLAAYGSTFYLSGFFGLYKSSDYGQT